MAENEFYAWGGIRIRQGWYKCILCKGDYPSSRRRRSGEYWAQHKRRCFAEYRINVEELNPDRIENIKQVMLENILRLRNSRGESETRQQNRDEEVRGCMRILNQLGYDDDKIEELLIDAIADEFEAFRI